MIGSSQSVHKVHKTFAPNCFLYLIMPIFSPSATIKICTLSKAPPSVWPHHQHTHKTSENLRYWFVLGPFQFQSRGQNIPLTSKSAIWLCWLSRKSWHTPLKPTKTEPSFRKLNSPPTKLGMLFPAHLHVGRGVMSTNPLPVIAPRMEPTCTHSC